MKNLIKIYWFAALSTLIIWVLIGWHSGVSALFTVLVLTLLEVTFSADNAVINSRVVITMSPFWQKLFLTIGIFTAVFVVRFALPVIIVMITGGMSFAECFDLIANDPVGYAEHLHEAGPLINSFGGAFLALVALCYFIDEAKKVHWISFIERPLARMGQVEGINVFIMLVASLLFFFTVDEAHQTAVLLAAILAVVLHTGLELLDSAMESKQEIHEAHEGASGFIHKTGLAALSAFIYLEILDSSFSLDGVIGAFAMTSDVILIMAGLGAGALWVRAMTIHLVQTDTLAKFKYMEHGAHWAIAFLGSVMLLKLYEIELSEWVVGGTGIILIILSILFSVRKGADSDTAAMAEGDTSATDAKMKD